MKIMILSDSHFMDKKLLEELMNEEPVDKYIHCGDIFMTYEGNMNVGDFYIVKGNNDFYEGLKKEIKPTIDGIQFFITHGHLYSIDRGVEYSLLRKAKEAGAKVICFGHTHKPYQRMIDGILCINPGSVSFPRGTYRKPTYCILDTSDMSVTWKNADTKEVLPNDLFELPDETTDQPYVAPKQGHNKEKKNKEKKNKNKWFFIK